MKKNEEVFRYIVGELGKSIEEYGSLNDAQIKVLCSGERRDSSEVNKWS